MYRLYSNPSIMLLGLAAATSAHAGFATLMQRELLAPLGLHDTFLAVPAARQQSRYAQGYTEEGLAARMTLGPLGLEAYGIRTTASDMLRFIDANMDLVDLNAPLRRAIVATHTGYYRIGAMTQDLVWEQYQIPVQLPALLQGNSEHMVFEENRAVELDPPARPERDVLIDKTGSTRGFAAYVAFIPRQEGPGIVLLANKSYPLQARVAAAYRILVRACRALHRSGSRAMLRGDERLRRPSHRFSTSTSGCSAVAFATWPLMRVVSVTTRSTVPRTVPCDELHRPAARV